MLQIHQMQTDGKLKEHHQKTVYTLHICNLGKPEETLNKADEILGSNKETLANLKDNLENNKKTILSYPYVRH